MHVCILNPNLYRSSGVTVAIKRVVLASDCHAVTYSFVLAQPCSELDDSSWINPKSMLVVNLFSKNPLRLATALIQLALFVRTNNIDILHSHHRRLAVYARLISLFTRVKSLYTAQLSYSQSLLFRLFCPTVCCAVSASVADNVKLTTNVRRIFITGNPAYFPSIDEYFSPAVDFAPTVICVARLSPVKRHSSLLKAWVQVASSFPNAKLQLLGEGPLEADLKKLTADLGLVDSVEFLGFVRDPSEYSRSCTFSVLASEVEGLPLAAIESCSWGRPILVTNVPGNRDLVPPDTELPNLVPLGDIPALASALCYWITNPQLVKAEGSKYAGYLRQKYSTESVTAAYLRAYTLLLS